VGTFVVGAELTTVTIAPDDTSELWKNDVGLELEYE